MSANRGGHSADVGSARGGRAVNALTSFGLCAFYGKSVGERRDSSAKTIATGTRANPCYSTSPPRHRVEGPYRHHPAASENELGGHFVRCFGDVVPLYLAPASCRRGPLWAANSSFAVI
jgi:hypothetical protein